MGEQSTAKTLSNRSLSREADEATEIRKVVANKTGLPVQTKPPQLDIMTGSQTITVNQLSGNTRFDVDSLVLSEIDEHSIDSEDSYRGSYSFETQPKVFAVLLLLIGCFASTAFLALGITKEQNEQHRLFTTYAAAIVIDVESACHGYMVAALWIHGACRKRNFSRQVFNELYSHLLSTGMQFESMAFIINVTSEDREALESEARAYYQNIDPNFTYHGFIGLEPDLTQVEQSLIVQPRTIQQSYLAVHYLEPFHSDEIDVDFDIASVAALDKAIQLSFATWTPFVISALHLLKEVNPDRQPQGYNVILFHPGIPSSHSPTHRDMSSITISIDDLITGILTVGSGLCSFYIFDTTDKKASPHFLGGASVISSIEFDLIHNEQTMLSVLRQSTHRVYERQVTVASSEWTILVADEHNRFQPSFFILIFGGLSIFLTCVCLALGIYSGIRRSNRISQMKSDAKAEQAALIVENANQSAQAERNLNEFIAHEIRNPLAAAIAACAFVTAAVDDEAEPLLGAEQEYISVKEDLRIVDSSLQFINDLLRNILDTQGAASDTLRLEMAPTHLLSEVLQPVDAMLYRRGDNWQAIVECPSDLLVMTDSLRLKQIVLNLSRNAAKFVDRGFILLRAEVVNGMVQLSVEDSGPGIPLEKQDNLFTKFQETLDSLSQGTGIGLSLCKSLTEIMGGSVRLDKTYHSGIKDCPGARFVISLNLPPLPRAEVPLEADQMVPFTTDHEPLIVEPTLNEEAEATSCLAKNLAVLIVDDDPILRSLLRRSMKRIAPHWDIHEAHNGETALELVDVQRFDLIFMDQHMTSLDVKQLLGTETTSILRAKGVTSIICGLSANNVQQDFYDAGANSFTTKPFPCKKEELTKMLLSLLSNEI